MFLVYMLLPDLKHSDWYDAVIMCMCGGYLACFLLLFFCLRLQFLSVGRLRFFSFILWLGCWCDVGGKLSWRCVVFARVFVEE